MYSGHRYDLNVTVNLFQSPVSLLGVSLAPITATDFIVRLLDWMMIAAWMFIFIGIINKNEMKIIFL